MAVKKQNAAALARYVSQLTGGGRELINILITIARDATNTPAERMAATRELLDRGYGKSALVIDAEVTVQGATLDVSKLSATRLAELRAGLLELAAASGVPVPALPAPRTRPLPILDVPSDEPAQDDAADLVWEDAEDDDA
jgi:hypothetical protein